MLDTNMTHAEKVQRCVMLAEQAEAKATLIRATWRDYHVRSRLAWIKRQHWWERKQKPLSDRDADVMADFSCKSDREFQMAIADNNWYIQQAQMYAAAAIAEGTRVRVPIPRPAHA